MKVHRDRENNLPTQIKGIRKAWLSAPLTLSIQSETSNLLESLGNSTRLSKLGLKVRSSWKEEGKWLIWDLSVSGNKARSGHTITIDLPILKPSYKVFTPSDRGVIDLRLNPTLKMGVYGANIWATPDEKAYVLPLVSVMDAKEDQALTIALPPDQNLPQMQVSWTKARNLRLSFGHMAIGSQKPASLRLMFTTHQADYRSALDAYARRFPAYFEAPLPRSNFEGSFWYHHIQDHPAFEEMDRQNVTFIWSSFWFTHLGNYLPTQKEWIPWTYSNWWKLGKTISDDEINRFISTMHQKKIGTFAYFNVTEYGGTEGKTANTQEAERILKTQFANALMKDAKGNAIPTWEGAMAMNARHQYSLWPFLQDQIQRHIDRLPGFEGFIIDRLDWAGVLDYGHDDGMTMVDNQPADNMALAVGEAVQGVCRLSHAAKKRVFVNQVYRVEVMKDVDGTCHESDYLAQRYLTPFRPAAAWHSQKPYANQTDLAPFEAHLKQRLQTALMPQMIAHEFPISQQAPDKVAADLLELYAPLFKVYWHKRQVLLPHCVSVSGLNDVNLYINGHHQYVVPVTSRTRFLTRGDRSKEEVTISIATPDSKVLRWAQAIPLDGKAENLPVRVVQNKAFITFKNHGSTTVLLVGKGKAPKLASPVFLESKPYLTRFLSKQGQYKLPTVQQPSGKVQSVELSLSGKSLYQTGPYEIKVNGSKVGILNGNQATIQCKTMNLAKPVVSITAGDEGVWYLPDAASIRVRFANSQVAYATWSSGAPLRMGSTSKEIVLPLTWSKFQVQSAKWIGYDEKTSGNWKGAYGTKSHWIAGRQAPTKESSFKMTIDRGMVFNWDSTATDSRMLQSESGSAVPSSCWYDPSELSFLVASPNSKPYRLSAYLVDYDRAERSVEVTLTDTFGKVLSRNQVTTQQMAKGVYVSWQATGSVHLNVRYTGKNRSANATVSGLFID